MKSLLAELNMRYFNSANRLLKCKYNYDLIAVRQSFETVNVLENGYGNRKMEDSWLIS